MNAVTDVFRGFNLLFGGILAGGMLLELLVVVPATRTSSAPDVVALYRRLAHRSLPFVLATGVPSAIAAIAVLILHHDFDRATTILRLIGVVVLLAGATATVTLYLPVFLHAKTLADDAPGDDVLPRWSRAQLVRTIFYAGGFAFFVAADVLY